MFQNKTGLYIHIPFCLQKCGYCDFATRPLQGARVDDYVDLLCFEISSRAPYWPYHTLQSIYFGGGTPSLLSPRQLIKIKNTILKAGFQLLPRAEVTIEINPGTLTKTDFQLLQNEGFNRFSLGGQTFNNTLLKLCGREHSAQQTLSDLKLLSALGLNYSFDLLFALPQQSLKDVEKDVKQILSFTPSHISAYCLTLPKEHKMNARRARGHEQVQMFHLIEQQLKAAGVLAYEVSNFARPGWESQHNTLYWTGGAYWGIGMSAHSYLPPPRWWLGDFASPTEPAGVDSTRVGMSEAQNLWGPNLWGCRFWHSKSLSQWARQVQNFKPPTNNNTTPDFKSLEKKPKPLQNIFVPASQSEHLQLHEAMSDFCHTRLRRRQGFNEDLLQKFFPAPAMSLIVDRLGAEQKKGLVECVPPSSLWRLSSKGVMLSDQVFEALTFLPRSL